MKKNNGNLILMRWILLAVVAWALSACNKAGSDSFWEERENGLPVSAVVHYGKGIGISEFYLNGKLSGHQYDGWGSSSDSCCLPVPTHPPEPMMVTVKWKTYRTSFKEERWHEATVPINFAVPPGDGYGLKVHFLPGHRVEIWNSDKGNGSSDYPGPAYPYKPAPDYVPLLDEAPEPPQGKQK